MKLHQHLVYKMLQNKEVKFVTNRNNLGAGTVSSVFPINSLTFLIRFPWQRAYLYTNYDYSNIRHKQGRQYDATCCQTLSQLHSQAYQ